MLHNWTWIQQNFMEWSLQGYVTVLGFFFWPLIFTAVIGYVYIKQQSITAGIIAVLLLFSAFSATGIFTGADTYVIIMQVFTIFVVTGLTLVFLTRVRRT